MILKAKSVVRIDIDQFDGTHLVFMKFLEPAPRAIFCIYLHDNERDRSCLKIVILYDHFL